jgi:hypothetical protein
MATQFVIKKQASTITVEDINGDNEMVTLCKDKNDSLNADAHFLVTKLILV